MSDNQFFNIGKNVFNKNYVLAITESADSNDSPVAVIHIKDRQDDPIYIELPKGKTLSDIISAEKLS